MGILEGKRLLVTGVLTDTSIAFHVARIAQEEGAHVVLTSFGRTMKITQTISRRLPQPVEVVELDVTNTEHLDTLAERAPASVEAYVAMARRTTERALAAGRLKRHEGAPLLELLAGEAAETL